MATRKLTPKQLAKALDDRITRAYYSTCCGIQVNVFDLSKIFKAGRDFIAQNPEANDASLGACIFEFVQTIRAY